MGTAVTPENARQYLARQDALVEQTRQKLREDGIEIVIAAASDLNGLLRGKRIPAQRFLDHPLEPVHLSDYFWAMDTEDGVAGREPGYNGWWPSWEAGFGDISPIPDLSSLRVAPWLDRTAVVLCEHFFLDGTPIDISPRHILRRLAQRAETRGLRPKFAAELEFFLFRETDKSLEEKGYRAADLQALSPRPSAYGISRGTADEHIIRPLAAAMDEFGIPVECWNPEGGAGQYEVNLVYSDLLEAADRAFLFKHAVKEIAAQNGLIATFMAKALPGFGSSCHVHQSGWSPDGSQNLFWDATARGNLSRLGLQFLGGQLASLRDLTLLFAPTVNSYKRLLPDSAAGTTCSWGLENRTCGLRVLHESEQGTRIENRVPGGDTNQFLVMAGCIAGGLYGIENDIKPSEPIEGNAYSDMSAPQLPQSLEEAITVFESSAVAKEYLGEEFVRFFAVTRRNELAEFRNAVTDWEIRRYLQAL